MVLTSFPTPSTREITIRFTSGTCIRGVDFGPRHRDEPVTLPEQEALLYVRQGRAVIEAPPVVQAGVPGADEGAGEADAATEPQDAMEPSPRRRSVPRKSAARS